ncbi:hypothetical protein FOMPIDRAFT_1053340 [Fomitopsis schrenkii]|uniref:F-box domain-containing protein n=1 Tax=Fomitopsis schrenkii TaxID=2126942 RepID=S8FD33_FOMSC|nr:hypothetical protein FOMPIDRAFT_1053340 [Fomitopsis schrenkii]
MPPKRRRDINSDVVALVIDHLEGDPRSLLACALTHKTWYPHTMKVLYATIRIRSRRACDALRARHTQPIDHCVAYTKVLEIHEESTGRFARWAILRLSDLPFLSLKRLVLTGIDYASGDDSPHPFWQVHGSLCRFGSVTTLELVKCTFPTFRHFLKLISSVPQLRRLKLAGLCAAAIPSILADAPVTTASRGLKLEELDMKGLSGRNLEHELLTWLSSDGGDGWAHTANLHVLRIRPAPLSQPNNWDATICDSITNVLDALAPLALTELAIPCMSQVRANLVGYKQLQSLTLFLRGDYYGDWERVCERAELTFLTLNAPSLRRLTLVLAVTVSSIKPWAKDGLSPLWVRLNTMVTAGHLARIQAAHIDFEWHAYREFGSSDLVILQRRMQGDVKRLKWHAQRILTVGHTENFFFRPTIQSAEGIVSSILQIGAWVSRIRGV